MRASKRLSDYNITIPTPQTLQVDTSINPIQRTYDPVLFDRWPPSDAGQELRRRSLFPDNLPLFVFPSDARVICAEERPRPSMHGFVMTGGDNTRLHGMCVTMWIPLCEPAVSHLNRRCEEWRNKNVSEAERELAGSLAERLTTERAKLSLLLADLSTMPSDTPERDEREEEILHTEERIALWTDAFSSVKQGSGPNLNNLAEGETGFWVPRAYGVLGRDGAMTSFWKEWLKAVVVPMTGGAVLGVPSSSPKIGMWQPLERYVANLCGEAVCPITSITQVEVSVRDLRLYARKTAANEIPGSRNTDLYPLFRCLDILDIVTLFEYVLTESRIVFVSSTPALLHSACAAVLQLMYPFTWTGIYIPILPGRLLQAIEAPCPYIIGIERQSEPIVMPEGDDCVLVDLDHGSLQGSMPPPSLPKQQRRKLISLLAVAAPHRYRFGVPLGPPPYALNIYPFGAFPSENPSVFTTTASSLRISHFAGLTSTAFGPSTMQGPPVKPLFNAFNQSRTSAIANSGRSLASSTCSSRSTSSPASLSPPFTSLRSLSPNPLYDSLVRTDTGYALQANLRDKRSGGFENLTRNSSVRGCPLTTPRGAFDMDGFNDQKLTDQRSLDSGPYDGQACPSPGIPLLHHCLVYRQTLVRAPCMAIQYMHNRRLPPPQLCRPHSSSQWCTRIPRPGAKGTTCIGSRNGQDHVPSVMRRPTMDSTSVKVGPMVIAGNRGQT